MARSLALSVGSVLLVVLLFTLWIYRDSLVAGSHFTEQGDLISSLLGQYEDQARAVTQSADLVTEHLRFAGHHTHKLTEQLEEFSVQREALSRLDDAVGILWTAIELHNAVQKMTMALAHAVTNEGGPALQTAEAQYDRAVELLTLLDRMGGADEAHIALVEKELDRLSELASGVDPENGSMRAPMARLLGAADTALAALTTLRAEVERSVMQEKTRLAQSVDQATGAANQLRDAANEALLRVMEYSRDLDALQSKQGDFEVLKIEFDGLNAQLAVHVEEMGHQALLVLALVVTSVVCVLLVINRVVLRPLYSLERGMTRVSQAGGAVDERLPVASRDVFGRLASSFNDMVDSLSATTVSRRFLDRVLESISEMLLVVNRELEVVRVNAATERNFGLSAEQLKGCPIDSLIELDSGVDPRLALRGAQASGGTGMAIPGDGEPIPVQVLWAALESQAGEGFVVVLHDARERLRSERTLRASEARFRDFAASAADWYWEMDENLRFSFVSDRFEQVTGVPPARLLGHTRQETGIPGVDPVQWQEHLDNLDHRRAFRDFVHPRTMPDGRMVWLSINGYPVFDSAGEFSGYRGTGADVTPRVEAEQAILAAKQAADESAQAKSDFLANMSHEIRTPINGVIGMVELLERTELDARQARFVASIQSCSAALLHQVDDVLDFAKIEHGTIELEAIEFSPVAFLDELCCAYEAIAAKKGLAMVVEVADDVAPIVVGDVHRLRQILTNFLSNAIKFTEAGGVEISVSATIADDGTEALEWSVQDSGIGIDADRAEKIFEPFVQADGSTTRRFGGTGLGLSICRRLAEIMGGDVHVQSAPEQGSRFWVCLPLDPAQAVSVGEPGPDALGAAVRANWLATPRVLVVDDNEVNREVATELLYELDCEVSACSGGEEALALVQGQGFDLVFMDCQMPDLDGFETTRRLRSLERAHYGSRQWPQCRQPLPVVALTANALEGDRARCLAAGMNDYLTKPVTLAGLEDTLARWLATDSALDRTG